MFQRIPVLSLFLAAIVGSTTFGAITTSGVTMVQNGGTFDVGNLAGGATAFAPDILGQDLQGPPQPIGFGGVHTTTGVNNLTYGNTGAWLSGSANSFVGLDLGGSFSVSSVAFGRDGLGGFSDRQLGLVTLQYTTVASPTYTTPAGSWTTIGTIDFTGQPFDYGNAARHRFNFAPVTATGLRLVTATAGRGIDEFEAYTGTFATPTLTLSQPTIIQNEAANAFGLGFLGAPIPGEPAPGDGQYRHANGPGEFTWLPLITANNATVETSWGVSSNHSKDVDYFYDPDGAGPLSEIALAQDVDQTFYADQTTAAGAVDWSGFFTIAEGLDITPEGIFRVTGTGAGGVAPEALTTAAWRFTSTPEPSTVVIWSVLGAICLGLGLRKRRLST